MDYRKIITIDPDIMGGKPCIRGLRITVYDVLDYLASGMTEEGILADFSGSYGGRSARQSRVCSLPRAQAAFHPGVKLLLDENPSPSLIAA